MHNMTIGIVHNIPCNDRGNRADASSDVMTQVDIIEETLNGLGYPTKRIPFIRDIEALCATFRANKIDVIFNLCESVDEDAQLTAHPAALFELLGIPFSGSPSAAIMLTTDKIMTKRLLRGTGIKTPACLRYDGSRYFNASSLRLPVIMKPRYEDASIGIDQGSVVETEDTLNDRLRHMHEQFGELIVEEYIEGREFNLSLFGYPSPRTMPIAEIDFSQYPKGLHRIVGYRAKWDKNSFEYKHTTRTFDCDIEQNLPTEMERIALQCFHYFSLRDYARIDMRLDGQNRIHVIEVNANPCLSPDAGFPASLAQANIHYSAMMHYLVTYMEHRRKHEDTKGGFGRPKQSIEHY